MTKIFTIIFLILCGLSLNAQTLSLKGKLEDESGQQVLYANISLHRIVDSGLVKVEISDAEGRFEFLNLVPDRYKVSISYVGYEERTQEVDMMNNQNKDLGKLALNPSVLQLQAATVIASRVMVEVKPDRTVFNVDGTINSAGDHALGLLRKAPGVLVDNNDNISVLGRSGVLVYVDGKRLPLQGEDLSNYLQNIPAEQIDRFDIITSPGAKYEAEGNAGIIDIRLKKSKNEGANATLSSNLTRGKFTRSNLSANGNYRTKGINIFGNVGFNGGRNFSSMDFISYQNGLVLDESNYFEYNRNSYDFRTGIDFFLNKNHTLGFLVTGRSQNGTSNSNNRTTIAREISGALTDSVLIGASDADFSRFENTFNLNYRFEKNKTSINVDVDYGLYRNEQIRFQPNSYFDPTEQILLSEIINSFDTPRDIDIATFKMDYETKLGKGTFGAGTKFSKVGTDNTFLFYNVFGVRPELNNRRSNQFDYDENVYATYLNFNSPLGEKWNVSAGLRAEQTDATGNLQAFDKELQEPPVEFKYLSWFPSAGLTYQVSQQNTLSLNYGRRINRPDYNILNPFNNQLSELSFEKGNPFLQPEIVNNLELGYTLKYRYNFKVGYSRTLDQITRLIGPSDTDDRASFITWENLATQTIWSANISAPVQITKIWNAFINLNTSYLDNQADYGNGAIVDVQALTYNIFQQHTIDLPKGFKGEVSGWFSGPGVWGGVFLYETSWSLNLGLQKRFFKNKLNAKLSVQDIFYESGWDGYSRFNGLYSVGFGRWDSRQVSLSLGYNLGNQNIKSRKRNTGLDDESKRVGN